ncbi:MAG: hypothetical protein KGH72_04125 [Candidatus Micrarchaeota archaeon]|nr:hypothetical protein [Candidatus Micrarchaeota archaeon]
MPIAQKASIAAHEVLDERGLRLIKVMHGDRFPEAVLRHAKPPRLKTLTQTAQEIKVVKGKRAGEPISAERASQLYGRSVSSLRAAWLENLGISYRAEALPWISLSPDGEIMGREYSSNKAFEYFEARALLREALRHFRREATFLPRHAVISESRENRFLCDGERAFIEELLR